MLFTIFITTLVTMSIISSLSILQALVLATILGLVFRAALKMSERSTRRRGPQARPWRRPVLSSRYGGRL